ncbi:MAG: ligase-associated DNA damage response endonuclease PdeM [Sphingomonadales bacterium]|nr:ligase-associated DNA damage response endonuclease PdeM [Sphingomonadales bacterium]
MLQFKPERTHITDYATHHLSLCGKALVADASGALYWPAERTLIVADLHLEKGSSFAARGVMLPPYDTRQTLQRLAEVIDRFDPQRVIALGDSLHDRRAADRIDATNLKMLSILQEDRQWVWITGNHDPAIAPKFGGRVVDQLVVGGIKLTHIPRQGRMAPEIAGHMHPAAKLSIYGHVIRRPCFVGNGRRLLLPAFGTFTGGLNVLDAAFMPLLGSDGMSVWMLGQEGLYPVATRYLCDD